MENNSTKWLQHFILLSAPLLTVIDVFIVNIAVPSIQQSLNASNAEVELVIAFYLLGYASFQITGSRAGDIFGRKKIFLWGMFLFVLTSCICGLSINIETLIIARFLQGVSGAIMQPQTLAYVQILFPEPKERTKAIGYIGITLGIASVLGQFLGGYLSGIKTFTDGWRFIFFINLPIGVIAFWAAKKYLKDTKIDKEDKFDYSGVVLLTLALGSLIYPLTEGRERDWPSWSFILLAVSAILFVVFVLNQRKKLEMEQHPLIDLRLFKIKDFNIGVVLVVFYFMVHTSYLLISTIYLQNGLQISSFHTGTYFVYSGLLFMVSSFFSIRLVNAYGKLPIQIGVILMILSYLFQAIFLNKSPNEAIIITSLLLWGLCGGFILPSLVNLTLKNVPLQYVGIASGMYNTLQQAASSIGICLIGGLFFTVASSREKITNAFHIGLYAEMICLLIVFILLVVIKDFKKKV
jgi:EmrB/QacA subfamily drug resistance transporter